MANNELSIMHRERSRAITYDREYFTHTLMPDLPTLREKIWFISEPIGNSIRLDDIDSCRFYTFLLNKKNDIPFLVWQYAFEQEQNTLDYKFNNSTFKAEVTIGNIVIFCDMALIPYLCQKSIPVDTEISNQMENELYFLKQRLAYLIELMNYSKSLEENDDIDVMVNLNIAVTPEQIELMAQNINSDIYLFGHLFMEIWKYDEETDKLIPLYIRDDLKPYLKNESELNKRSFVLYKYEFKGDLRLPFFKPYKFQDFGILPEVSLSGNEIDDAILLFQKRYFHPNGSRLVAVRELLFDYYDMPRESIEKIVVTRHTQLYRYKPQDDNSSSEIKYILCTNKTTASIGFNPATFSMLLTIFFRSKSIIWFQIDEELDSTGDGNILIERSGEDLLSFLRTYLPVKVFTELLNRVISLTRSYFKLDLFLKDAFCNKFFLGGIALNTDNFKKIYVNYDDEWMLIFKKEAQKLELVDHEVDEMPKINFSDSMSIVYENMLDEKYPDKYLEFRKAEEKWEEFMNEIEDEFEEPSMAEIEARYAQEFREQQDLENMLKREGFLDYDDTDEDELWERFGDDYMDLYEDKDMAEYYIGRDHHLWPKDEEREYYYKWREISWQLFWDEEEWKIYYAQQGEEEYDYRFPCDRGIPQEIKDKIAQRKKEGIPPLKIGYEKDEEGIEVDSDDRGVMFIKRIYFSEKKKWMQDGKYSH